MTRGIGGEIKMGWLRGRCIIHRIRYFFVVN